MNLIRNNAIRKALDIPPVVYSVLPTTPISSSSSSSSSSTLTIEEEAAALSAPVLDRQQKAQSGPAPHPSSPLGRALTDLQAELAPASKSITEIVADTVKGPLYGVGKADYEGSERQAATTPAAADTLSRMAKLQLSRGKGDEGYVLYKRAFRIAQAVAMDVRQDYNDGDGDEDDDEDEHSSLRRVLDAENTAAITMFDCAAAAESLSKYADAAVLYGRASDLLVAVQEEWQTLPRPAHHGDVGRGSVGPGGMSQMIQEARHKAALFVAVSGKAA